MINPEGWKYFLSKNLIYANIPLVNERFGWKKCSCVCVCVCVCVSVQAFLTLNQYRLERLG